MKDCALNEGLSKSVAYISVNFGNDNMIIRIPLGCLCLCTTRTADGIVKLCISTLFGFVALSNRSIVARDPFL